MHRAKTYFWLLFFMASYGFSAEFFVHNASFSGSLPRQSEKHGDYVLHNFRIRIVTEDISQFDSDKLLTYLIENQKNIKKAFVYPILTESESIPIDIKDGSNRLTLLVSADSLKNGEQYKKFFLYAEDLLIGDSLHRGDSIKLNIQNFFNNDDNEIHMTYSMMVDHKDGSGFQPVEAKSEGDTYIKIE